MSLIQEVYLCFPSELEELFENIRAPDPWGVRKQFRIERMRLVTHFQNEFEVENLLSQIKGVSIRDLVPTGTVLSKSEVKFLLKRIKRKDWKIRHKVEKEMIDIFSDLYMKMSTLNMICIYCSN